MKEPGWPFGNRPLARVLWELWKGRVASCEMNEHPLGWQIRCNVNWEFHYSHVAPLRHLAEEEAAANKRHLVDHEWRWPAADA